MVGSLNIGKTILANNRSEQKEEKSASHSKEKTK